MQGFSTTKAWARRRLQLKDESGLASIETAISLTVLFSVVFWMFEMSMFAYTYAVLDDAAHEGIRYAVAHGIDSSNCSGPTTGCTDTSGANVAAVVKSYAKMSLHNVSAAQILVSYPDATGCKPGSLVKITISYAYVPFINLAGFSPTANVSAEGRIVF